jgi:hypothetical protein
MTLILYAQPYDVAVEGFYFRTAEEYDKNVEEFRNYYGESIEEVDIEFIDGEQLDAEFASAFGLNQGNFIRFLELADQWEDHEKIRFIIARTECGYSFDPQTDDIDQLEIDIYEVGSLKQLAEQFVDDGLFGEIPKALEFYIDYEAIARDLAVDYSMIEIAGDRFAYRCG